MFADDTNLTASGMLFDCLTVYYNKSSRIPKAELNDFTIK